jgi:hypothetical protein
MTAVVVRDEWRACLLGVIGYSRETVDHLYSPGVGINTVDAFTEIPAASFDAWLAHTSKKSNFPAPGAIRGQAAAVGVTMPWIPNNKLKALRYYLDYFSLCGLPLDVSIFDAAALQAWKLRMAYLEDFAKMKAADKIQTPKPLLVLTKSTTWEIMFKAYLSHQRSSRGGCPLTYVIRDELVVPKTYSTIDDQMIDLSLPTGPNYAIDNRMVYDLFSQLIIPTDNNLYIQPFAMSKDGRAAFMAIKACAEGLNVKAAKQSAAVNKMDTTKCSGTGKMNFELYIQIHTQAHNDLAQIEEPCLKRIRSVNSLMG